MVQDQLASKERYSKAPELALWATENEGDGRAYSDPFEPKSRFPSVTTVLKLVEKSALVGWAARKVAEKAIERWMDMGRDPEQIMKWLPFAHNAYRDDRGWVGSGLHAAIDADCKGEWFVHELNDEQKGKILGQIPAGRMGSAEEIAAAVLYLASPEAGYVTGQVLAVDGGAQSGF